MFGKDGYVVETRPAVRLGVVPGDVLSPGGAGILFDEGLGSSSTRFRFGCSAYISLV